MKTSQFDAKTYGVGQLITQRKLFRVPSHQRSYAWEQEAVWSFLTDIGDAYEERNSDYFIGLVVAQGPQDAEWVLLDGQQRLITTSLMYAAIRHWLATHGHEDDAQQINHEYLGVRRLGGDYSSRMLLNLENQPAFAESVVKLSSDNELRALSKTYGKRESNRLLLEAALACRSWVSQIATSASLPAQALYDLSQYLDSRVKVVCVDVSSEVDAYVLFESLNDRGVELSALDLIKNYVISKSGDAESKWESLTEALGDFNPDDFLKIFWTNRYGPIQKTQIFRRVKESYPSPHEALQLLDELITDATLLAAIEDDDHPYWEKVPGIRDQVYLLRQIGAKQARPVLIAALRCLSPPVTETLVWQLIVGIIRFQTIGRGRTGVVEKVLGRLCQSISRGDIHSPPDCTDLIAELITEDGAFANALIKHDGLKFARISYLIAEYLLFPETSSLEPGARATRVRWLLESTHLRQLLTPDGSCVSLEFERKFRLLGNFDLEGVDGLVGSRINPAIFVHEPEDISSRTELIAGIAPQVWR